MRFSGLIPLAAVSLLVCAAPRAAAQLSVPPAATSDSGTVQRAQEDTVLRGPRLPEVVHPVTPRFTNEAVAAPHGNLVIPVTTALIVLSALVVILLLT